MPRITIDGQSIEVQEGWTILQAASELGIQIPTLCYHKDLSPVGSCRLCMVEVDSSSEQAAACTSFVADGMTVRTETDSLTASRRFVLRMLLNTYCSSGGEDEDNEFLHWVRHYGLKPSKSTPTFPVDSDPNPFIRMDLNLWLIRKNLQHRIGSTSRGLDFDCWTCF